MLGTLIKILVIIISLFLPMESFSAEAVQFMYILSVYSDGKGEGIKQPEGVSCNDKSILIAADTGNGRLLRYTFQDRTLKTAVGGINLPQLPYPVKVKINSKGEIFALDGKQRRIIHLSPEGEYKGYVNPEGISSPAYFVPRSFKIDSKDNVYILDVFGARVIVLGPDSKYQRHISFPKDYGFFSDLQVDF